MQAAARWIDDLLGRYARMDSRVPPLVFFALGVLFLIFSRQVAAGFGWLQKKTWDDDARNRFPHLAPLANPPRSLPVYLGIIWIVTAILLWLFWES